MSSYKLKTPKSIEKAVVGTYKKIENKFVDTFLEKVDTLEQPEREQIK